MAGVDPFDHYMMFGWSEQRRPTPWFSVNRYREAKPDCATDGNPLVHLAGMSVTDARNLLSAMRAGHYRDRKRVRECTGLLEGVCMTGFFQSEIGLGQAARNLAYAADGACVPLTFLDVHLPGRAADKEFATKCSATMDRFVHLFILSAAWTAHWLSSLRPDGVNVLYPFWELSRIPEGSLRVVERFDEIWAPSRFIQESFRASTDRPVMLLPQPVRIPEVIGDPAERSGPFTVLTYLDFDSFPDRKNCEGAVAAFQLAFPLQRRDVRLIVKVRGKSDGGRRSWLADVVATDSRVVLIDETLDRDAMDRLVLDCDAFISLHRSEGFGFGPAEALAAGKPVVSTDYSGTTDFIRAETGYPVAYDLVPVGEGAYVEWENHVWAEPSIDDAACMLREIEANRDMALARARRGRQLMIDVFSTQAVGARMRSMLEDRGLLTSEVWQDRDLATALRRPGGATLAKIGAPGRI
ncbi:MAG: glycosyltransferase, partial [Parvibaculum sp.]|nr:glycosyltransferase [Parvibaculum sp.]